MWNHFFKHIDIQPENANILDGNATDVKQECEDFERKITKAGGIELFVGGRELQTTISYIILYNNNKIYGNQKCYLIRLHVSKIKTKKRGSDEALLDTYR